MCRSCSLSSFLLIHDLNARTWNPLSMLPWKWTRRADVHGLINCSGPMRQSLVRYRPIHPWWSDSWIFFQLSRVLILDHEMYYTLRCLRIIHYGCVFSSSPYQVNIRYTSMGDCYPFIETASTSSSFHYPWLGWSFVAPGFYTFDNYCVRQLLSGRGLFTLKWSNIACFSPTIGLSLILVPANTHRGTDTPYKGYIFVTQWSPVRLHWYRNSTIEPKFESIMTDININHPKLQQDTGVVDCTVLLSRTFSQNLVTWQSVLP